MPVAEYETTYDANAELVKINPVPSIIMDMQTMGVVLSNEATSKLLGFSEQELLGRKITELIPEEDVPRAIEATGEPAPEGETMWRCLTKTGSVLYVKVEYRDTTFRGKAARFIIVIESSKKPFGN